MLFESNKHWAFEPVHEPDAPAVQSGDWPRNDIDRFLLARIEAASKSPLPQADRRTLIRRLTYDLNGLPPAPEEVAAFELDNRPDAYERLVDRLLAAPRMASNGGAAGSTWCAMPTRQAKTRIIRCRTRWRYRNWVIDAFAHDLPYDEFIRQQIAGDLLALEGPADAYADHVIATGYLAIARRFGHDIEKDVHLTLEDTLDTMGKSVLGLSIGCCRCHDHKYDPLTTPRLLRAVRHLCQYEIRVSRLRAQATPARPGTACLAGGIRTDRASFGRKDSPSAGRGQALDGTARRPIDAIEGIARRVGTDAFGAGDRRWPVG